MAVAVKREVKVEALPVLFIGDLFKIEGEEPQGSCIDEGLYVCDFNYEQDSCKIELNLCTRIDEDKLKEENVHVVTGIDFELSTENERSIRGSISADVVSDEAFTVHLTAEVLQGKFKITQYHLIPIGLLRVLHANMSKRDARRNGCDPSVLNELDVFERMNAGVQKARQIELNSESEKVMTSDEKKELNSVQESLNRDRKSLFSTGLGYIQHINSTNWIGNFSSLLREIDLAKKKVKSHEKFLDKLAIKHEEKLEFVSVLKDNGIRYVYKVEKLNEYMRREHCFVLFFHRKSQKSNPENYEKLLAFFQNFTKMNKNSDLVLENEHAFLAVDRHVISRKRLAITPPKESAIYHISRSVIKTVDLMKDCQSLSNIARMKTKDEGHKSDMRGRLSMRCPKKGCPNTLREWLCQDCGGYFDFGFNGCLYCNCNIFTRKGAFLKNVEFRCKDPGHGFYFASYNERCKDDLNRIVPIQNVNILVLGQRNAGKTTFIKSVISVLAYNNWEDAQTKIIGLEEGKVLKTEKCKIYSVRFRDYNFRFVDTPGFTKGIDGANVDTVKKIMSCVREFECLHGICVLVKSHESETEMPTVKSCVKQILSLFHWNLTNNVVFCSTYYPSDASGLGNTLPVLKDIVTKLKLSNANLFHFFDLEFYDTFKTQSTNFNDVEILTTVSPDEKVYFKNNWEKRTKEANRLLDFLVTLKPQRVRETLVLNESHIRISKLLFTMFEVMEDVEKNVNTIRQVRKTIRNFRALGKDQPENVCTDKCCVQYLTSSLPEKRVCHCPNDCYGDREDYDCEWKTHVYIHSGCENTEIQITTKYCEVIVRNKKSSETEAPRNLENHASLLYKEKAEIKEIGEKLASFLKHHAILADNFWCCDYLYCFVGPNQLENKELIVTYFRKVKSYEKDVIKWFSKDDRGEFEDLDKLEQELRNLRTYGRKFKKETLTDSQTNDSAVSSSSGKTLLDRLFGPILPLDCSMYSGSKRESTSDETPGPSKIQKK